MRLALVVRVAVSSVELLDLFCSTTTTATNERSMRVSTLTESRNRRSRRTKRELVHYGIDTSRSYGTDVVMNHDAIVLGRAHIHLEHISAESERLRVSFDRVLGSQVATLPTPTSDTSPLPLGCVRRWRYSIRTDFHGAP